MTGRYGVRRQNVEGQMVVDFAKRMEIAFKKTDEHRITMESGRRFTQDDYLVCQRPSLKEIGDCKVIVGENVAIQH